MVLFGALESFHSPESVMKNSIFIKKKKINLFEKSIYFGELLSHNHNRILKVDHLIFREI